MVFASKGQMRLFIPKLCRIIAGMSEESFLFLNQSVAHLKGKKETWIS